MKLIKYPRTQHIYGSRIQKGDEDLEAIPFKQIKHSYLIIEEKMDGANSAISFEDGELYLQSRGHYLTGGPREGQFSLFKQWANTHKDMLLEILKDRYIMFGEWLYAKHTVYYDNLPHYFMEFDIYDKHSGRWLSTTRRALMIADTPICSVHVITSRHDIEEDELPHMASQRSEFITDDSVSSLIRTCAEASMDIDQVLKETDQSGLREGLYIKQETVEEVVGRFKWVRKEFLDAVQQSGSHWFSRTIIPNKLNKEIDLFSIGD